MKHSQFRNYLNGQQQFRLNVIKQIEKLVSTWQCYEDGIISNENISLRRYTNLPVDPNDVSQVSRALRHVTTTMSLLHEQEKFLRNILSSIADRTQLLARNEHDFIQGYIATTKELDGQVILLEYLISFTLKTLEKRFNKVKLIFLMPAARGEERKSKIARKIA